jgi:uncharacterized protein YihD (DUF1040 family)
MSEKEPFIEDDVIQAIKEAWAQNPDMRLTQLLINAIAPGDTCSELYSIEDSKLIKLLNNFKNR